MLMNILGAVIDRAFWIVTGIFGIITLYAIASVIVGYPLFRFEKFLRETKDKDINPFRNDSR